MSARLEYKPEYCEAIVAHCEAGGSISSFGGVVGVARVTIWSWQKKFPEFAEACDIAKQKALFLAEKAHWELAQQGGKTSGLEYRMGNLSEWTAWRFKTATEVTGANDGPVRMETSVNVEGLSDEQLAVLASIPAG